MSNFPDLEVLAHQKWPEFETRLAELLYLWSEYDVAPVDLESEVGAFALRVAHEAQDEDLPPKMPPVETPDNSTALFGAVFLGGGVLVGGALLVLIGFPPLILLVLIPGALLAWGFTRMEWTTKEQAEQRARADYERELARWEERQKKYDEVSLITIFRRKFHEEIGLFLGVPRRVLSDFARVSMDNHVLRRSQCDEYFQEWVSLPEFPEPPPATPAGVSHKDYEEFCSQVLMSWGYLDVRVTRFSSDGGIDIVSDQLVAQCKHYAGGSVGVREVRELFGVATSEGKTGVVFTSGRFTAEAKKFADKTGVGLVILREGDGVPRLVDQSASEISKFHG